MNEQNKQFKSAGLSVWCLYSPDVSSKINDFKNVYYLIKSLSNKNWKFCKNLFLRVLITAHPTFAQNFSYQILRSFVPVRNIAQYLVRAKFSTNKVYFFK